MSNISPTHRGQSQTRARLNFIESLLADRALTAEELRVALRREHAIDLHVSTVRTYAQALVDEGRAVIVRVRTAASPNQRGVLLVHAPETPAKVVEEALATLKAQGSTFARGPGMHLPSRRQVVPRG